jgi:hypothetical protein
MRIKMIYKVKKLVFFIILLFSRNVLIFSEESKLLITIESNKEVITNDDNITFTVHIKNITDSDYELFLNYFMFASFYLKFSYYDSLNQEINIPLSDFAYVSKSFKTPFKILKSSEVYSISIIGTYKYIDDLWDIRTLKRYSCMAFVFEDDYSFFSVPQNINKLEISYYANEELKSYNMVEINISDGSLKIPVTDSRDL